MSTVKNDDMTMTHSYLQQLCHLQVRVPSLVLDGVTPEEVSRHVRQHHQHALHLLHCLLLKVFASSLTLSCEVSLG